MISLRLPLSCAIAVPLVLAACGGESLTLPPDGAAAHIEITAGNGQEGRVGATLETPLAVLVTDTRGRPVGGAEVEFTITDSPIAGEAIPASATTGGDGRASTTLKLGSRAGQVGGVAEVPVEEGVTPVRVTFTLNALPADAAGMRLFAGDPQTATVNSPLPAPLVVQVTDVGGNPIPNRTIEWTAEGGGSVSATTTVTDANGLASVTRTLGGTAGPQSTTARSDGLAGSPVLFTHTATAGGANGLVKFAGDGQSAQAGTPLANPIVVQVLDAQGNPIPDRAVTWVVGEGAVSPENTTTNAEGKASTTWTLGSTPGPKTANAVVSGVGTATFNATATAGSVSAANSSVSASPGTVTVGGTSTITVTVRDGNNNPVAGASVTLASSGTGNTISPETASSAGNGVATFSFSSTVAETKTITATAGGVAISDQATVTVQKASSTIEITEEGPDPSRVGEPLLIEFTVTGSGGTPSGEVIVTLSGGDEACRAPLGSDGTGACTLTPTQAGPDGANNRRIITARYSGDARFEADTDTENHRVLPAGPSGTTTTITSDTPDPSDAGAQVTVSFTVTSGSGTPSGTVEVTAEGGGGCSATVAQGSCQLTPTLAGQTITLTATYQGGSGFSGSSDTEEHTVNAAPPVNAPPTAGNDTYQIPDDQITTIPAPGVLVNDADADGPQPMIARILTQPAQGTVTMETNGSFTYTPTGISSGTDSFTYEAFDGAAATPATVTLTFIAGIRLK